MARRRDEQANAAVVAGALALVRPGLTGFGGSHDRRWNLASFRAACHAMARAVPRTALGECEGPHQSAEYYRARVDHEGTPLWLLLNAVEPVLAFAQWGQRLDYRFVDAPLLAAAFHGPHELATAAQLETRLAPQDWETRLHGQELAQARHWRPERVGDLVFSWWD
ncbi:hypothetical protein [Nannocystis sp. SCPEA4]|uniref:hypothetical protein n=1 Tax=Nannocystis sp. SCPEA4 TaxID=2996787 RepID=UPI00226F9932|nr:hypothetical protein [Nannocystis sp. SCPEA4]MCY1058898.1 hypothetical protein [Nannocystis sp. SCPEA4]